MDGKLEVGNRYGGQGCHQAEPGNFADVLGGGRPCPDEVGETDSGSILGRTPNRFSRLRAGLQWYTDRQADMFFIDHVFVVALLLVLLSASRVYLT